MTPKRISVIFGTRPEAIKLAPIVLGLEKHVRLHSHVCVTAQHREMLDQALGIFGVHPEADLDLMLPNQSLPALTARAVQALDGYLAAAAPDLVLVQGDTTTTFCAGLAAFYRRIPVGHVEAGLRTGDKFSPFPEEINRRLTTQIADLHFAPTTNARDALLNDGVRPEKIYVTGNTVIDALQITAEYARTLTTPIAGLPPDLADGNGNRRMILITGHRRENFGSGIESICKAIDVLANQYPDAAFVYPVHLNPNVLNPVRRFLGGLPNVYLIAPLGYVDFVRLMNRSYLVITDSGGVQEEAPSLGKPVLVTRNTTERPEAVAGGNAVLVGTDAGLIVRTAVELLSDESRYCAMSRKKNPYGDGKATERIIQACDRFLL